MKRAILRRFAPACLLICLLLCGCKNEKLEVVAVCGGDPVLREEYDYLAARLEAGLSEDAVREQLSAPIIEDRAVLAMGQALLDGLTVDDREVQDAVDAGLKSAIEDYGGKSAFRQALKEQVLTEHHFRRMLAVAEIQRRVQETVFAGTGLESETAFAAWLKSDEHYARVEQFGFDTLSAAEEFLSAVRSGNDAEVACGQKGGTKRSAAYFFRGLGGDAVDRAVFALPCDGTTLSAPVEQANGSFTVYRRLPVRETEREDMAAMQGLAVLDRLRDLRWNELLREYQEKLSVEWVGN